MKKVALSILIVTALGGLTASGISIYQNIIASEQQPEESALTQKPEPNKEIQSDPTTYDTFDVEFSKKLILYHQLAAQLDDYAYANAIQPDVREFAAKQSAHNTQQANAYIALLDGWGQSYSNLEDFPKVAGGGCSGYPTFPGMLPHADVNSYLQTTADEVDRQYLSLMTKHHSGINLIVKAEGSFITHGDLIALRDAFYTSQANELMHIQELQKQYEYSA